MTISKTTMELSAVAALLGGFYHQGNRLDEFMRRQDARVDGIEQRLGARINDLELRLDARIDGLAERLARIKGILDRWLATTPSRPPQQPS